MMVSACTLVVLLSPVCSGQDRLDCLPWEKEASNASTCECRNDLKCRDGVLYLHVNHCLTYSQSTLYEATCPFIKMLSNSSFIRVPTNLSEINSFFCSPFNRRGLVCSQCKQGYGVSFLTVGLKCVKCSSPLSWLDSLSCGPVLASHSLLHSHFHATDFSDISSNELLCAVQPVRCVGT